MGESSSKLGSAVEVNKAFYRWYNYPAIATRLTSEECLDLVATLVSNFQIRSISELPPSGQLGNIPSIMKDPSDLLTISFGDAQGNKNIFLITRPKIDLWYILYLIKYPSFDGRRLFTGQIEGKYCATLNCVLLFISNTNLTLDSITNKNRLIYHNLDAFPIYYQKVINGTIYQNQPYGFNDLVGEEKVIFNKENQAEAVTSFYSNGSLMSLVTIPRDENYLSTVEIYSTDNQKLFQFNTIQGVKHGPEYRWFFVDKDPSTPLSTKYWWFGKQVTIDEYSSLINKEIQTKTGLPAELSKVSSTYY